MFADEANGSLLKDKQGQAIGSALIGQTFSEPKYFWSRPSATSPYGYNAAASSGSNLRPDQSGVGRWRLPTGIKALKAADPENNLPVPVDLVDSLRLAVWIRNISPAAAEYQVKRVAKVRKMNEDQIRELVAANTEGRQWASVWRAQGQCVETEYRIGSIRPSVVGIGFVFRIWRMVITDNE